jgi:hypothetical protein
MASGVSQPGSIIICVTALPHRVASIMMIDYYNNDYFAVAHDKP